MKSIGQGFNYSNQLPEQIESEHLIIRVARPGDGELLNKAIIESAEHLSGWVPWITPLPSIADSELKCQESYDNFLKNKDLMMLFFLKGDNSLIIGGSGLHNIDWELRHFKVGYWGHYRYIGKGLITEGVKALVEYALINLKAKKMYLHIDQKNINSCKLAKRIGFKLKNIINSNKLGLSGKQRIINVYSLKGLELN